MSTAILKSSFLTKHPKGLIICFFAELWERFSFYGFRALLILYMTSQLLFADEKAYGVYAAYTCLVYITQIVGGFLADQILGNRKAITIGGVLIFLGHISLTFESIQMFYSGLAFIICGTGLFKSNLTALVGQLYPRADPRKDSGYTLYYVGINIGAVTAPLACSYIGHVYGWHYAFGTAAVGMLAGLITFLWGTRLLEDKGLPPSKIHKKKVLLGLNVEQVIYLLAFVSVPLFSILVVNNQVLNGVMPTVAALVLIYISYIAIRSPVDERIAIFTIMALMVFTCIFWGLFEQAGSSINLFIERNINKNLFGFEIPTGWFQSVSGLVIISLGPVYSVMWAKLASKNKDFYPPMKFVLGLLQATLGFAVLVLGIQSADANGMVSMGWVVLAFILHTTGELCVVPIGLSLVSKIAPVRMLSLLMGTMVMSMAFGNFIAGLFARLASVATEGGKVLDVHGALATYEAAFTTVLYFGLGSAAVLLVLTPFLNKAFARIEKTSKQK